MFNKLFSKTSAYYVFTLVFAMPIAAKEKTIYKLINLDPGHFHAALVQKNTYPNVASEVKVYGPKGDDVRLHLNRIERFNSRSKNPTNWQTDVYQDDDYFEKMLSDKAGDIVVIAGNNKRKTDYILKSLQSGFNVYADKPMVANVEQFKMLQQAFDVAEEKDLLLLDIMTERYEITSILQKAFSQSPEVFGSLVVGSVDQPAITKESVHHFFKYVSGKALQRPAWVFDEIQQGDGLVDVTTHLVDLIQWEAFPDEAIDYQKDIKIENALRWPTKLTMEQFSRVTKLNKLPDYLKKNFKGNALHVFANGEINYKIRGIHARAKVIWNYQAPEGTGDTHYSIMRGNKSNLVIRQGEEEKFIPELYVEPSNKTVEFESALAKTVSSLAHRYPGLAYSKAPKGWKIIIPQEFRVGHEAHFTQVTEAYLNYLSGVAEVPHWERPNMLAKYYLTTTALEQAKTINN